MTPTAADPLARALAIWGAVVATVALVWNIIRDRRDRASVKVGVSVAPVPGQPLEYNELIVCVVNKGRRPVTVIACSLLRREFGKVNQVIPPRGGQFPIKLAETETGTISCGEFSAAAADGLEEVRVIDSTGRVWKVRKRAIRKQLRRAQEVREHFEKVIRQQQGVP